MSTSTYDVTQPNVSLAIDNATFDVLSGASLNLTGSSDTVILESGAGGATVTGNNNRVNAGGANNADFGVTGTGNTATVGAGDFVSESGSGNMITLGADGSLVVNGNNSTFYALDGGDDISVYSSGNTFHVNNDRIELLYLAAQTATISGNGNVITDQSSNLSHVISLGGSNNTVNLGSRTEVDTSTASVTEGSNGLVLKGSVTAANASLSGGVLSVQLGNGNVAAMSGVASGTQVEYIDASGNASWTTLVDSNLVPVGGGMYNVTAKGVYATMSNAVFDVLSGASLNVTGSSDTILVESGSGGATVTGSNNHVNAGGVNNADFGVTGTGNTVTVGSDSFVSESGSGNSINLGANGSVATAGNNTTIYAFQGGDEIDVYGTGDTFYAINDNIQMQSLGAQTATINGNGNVITDQSSGNNHVISLGGSNNTVNLGSRTEVDTGTGSITEGGNGLVLTGSVTAANASLSGGVLSVQLGSGNAAVLAGVGSGVQVEYIDASGNASWTTLVDSNLVPVGGGMYNVTAKGVYATMSNAVFDVLSGASLNVTGSSDTILVESGSGGATVTGSNNHVNAGGVNNADFSVTGTGNTVTVGSDSFVSESGSGNSINLGANGSLAANGNNTTIYAFQGGDNIEVWGGTGDTFFAANDNIQMRSPGAQTATINGNGNVITDLSSGNGHVISLGGSNNTVNLGSRTEVDIGTGSITEGGNGLVLTGSVSAANASLAGGVLSVQLGNGNVATMSGVASGTQIEYIDASGNASWTTLVDKNLVPVGTNQLVAAMASYVPESVGATSMLASQMTADPALFASSHH